ncbi:MAG: hypothetical protein EP329_18635 [Deltaproteobacteria bacterium]|nr:MAG: hypothetical protein EP329_18635 [Deltaproteobacteria bacterium]
MSPRTVGVRDESARTRAVRAALGREGFATLADVDLAGFDALVDALGGTALATTVRLSSDVRSYLCSPGAIPLHADDPRVPLIAWRCERQDDVDGASLLVDLRAIIEGMTRVDRELLAKIRLRGGRMSGEAHIYEPRSGRCFWAPWLTHDAEGTALEALERLRAEIERAPVTRIRLAPGDVLVVDNRRVLHGRHAVSPESLRHLERRWIGPLESWPR